jgi:hypothetical protein
MHRELGAGWAEIGFGDRCLYDCRRMTRILLYTGKGGVGKTSIAAASA